MSIFPATTNQHYEQARQLFQEYSDWLGIDLSFQNFDTELQSLPQIYGPPRGRLFLALDGAEAAGCVGVRSFPTAGQGTCEMKRLYVRPTHRGNGLGRRLAQAAVNEARSLGYHRMLLDSLQQMEHAAAVYRALGFRQIGPYYENPVEGIIFMELNLISPSHA